MPETSLPWEIHPHLTEERLRIIARLIRDVRQDALETHEPSKGDGRWGLACRVYERTCFAIAKAASDPAYRDWLRVIEQDGLIFIFQIGDLPFRFYSGDPDAPPARAARCFEVELEQLELLDIRSASRPGAPDELRFRIIVTTDPATLTVSAVTLIQIDGAGAPYNPYPIPLDGASVLHMRTRRPGVELEPPRVGPAPADEDKKAQ